MASCAGGVQTLAVTTCQDMPYIAKSATQEIYQLPTNAAKSHLLTPNVIRVIRPRGSIAKVQTARVFRQAFQFTKGIAHFLMTDTVWQ